MKQFTMDGYVCGKVDTRSTNSGKEVTTFSINSPDHRKNQQTGEWENVPQFFRCQYWHKSDRDFKAFAIKDKAHLVISGDPKFEEWESEGIRKNRVTFNVRDLWPVERAEKSKSDEPVYDEDIPF